MSPANSISRRAFLKLSTLTAVGTALLACAPAAPTPTQAPAQKEEPTAEKQAATVAPTTAPAKAEEAVTISFWHIWGGVRIDQLQSVLDDFMEANSKIKVEPLLLPNPGYADKIITALAGDAPDLTMIYTDEFAPSAKRGALLDLASYLERDAISPDIWYEGQWAMTQMEGHTYGLPFVGNFLGLTYWSKDDFQAAGFDPEQGPQTWDDALNLAKTLTRFREDGSIEHLGCDTAVGGGWGGGSYRNGVNWLGNGTPDELNINHPQSLEALKYAKDMYDVQGGWDKVGLAREDWANAQAGNALIAGLTSVLHSGVFTVNVINEQAPDLNYKLGKVPHGPQGEFLDVTVAAWNNVIPKRGQHPDEAWELAKYLSMGQGHLKFMVELQGRPAMVKEYNEAPYDQAARKKNPYWDEVLEVLNGKHMSYPVSDKLGGINRITGEAFESLMLEQRTLEEAADWAQEEVIKLLQEEE